MPFLPDRRHALRCVGAALAALGALAAGCDARRQTAPDAAYTLLDGTPGHLGALRGRVVLVNFWATSCAVCVQEMPALASTFLRYRERGFETLAVAMRHDAPARVSHFAQARALPFGVVIDNTGAIARAFGDVAATPTSFLIDRRGAIAHRFTGTPSLAELHTRVEQLLGET